MTRSRDPVAGYYEQKTPRLLAKYGPGPRVHFHTGLLEDAPPRGAPASVLRARLVRAQEDLLRDSAAAWDAADRLSGRVLDVGCGLGGGALFLAGEHGARVTALTNVPSHAALVRRFAAAAGVSERVTPLVADACRLPVGAVFDAALAIEASCYLPRDAWFRALADALRPGARVHVVDCFAGRPDVAAAFDAYWRTRIGTLAEYDAAAAAAGFRAQKRERLSARCVGFWSVSLAWTAAALRATRDRDERARLLRSRAAHEALRRHFADGGIEYLRLSFER